MAAPFLDRGLADPTKHRRIVRPDGNVQKCMTAPENKRRPNVAKGADLAGPDAEGQWPMLDSKAAVAAGD